MNNKNVQNTNEESRAKSFWKHVGFIGIALALAVITVFVLHLNV